MQEKFEDSPLCLSVCTDQGQVNEHHRDKVDLERKVSVFHLEDNHQKDLEVAWLQMEKSGPHPDLCHQAREHRCSRGVCQETYHRSGARQKDHQL